MNECWWSLAAPWSGRNFFQALADESEEARFHDRQLPPRVVEVLLSEKYQTQSSKLVQRKARGVLAPLFSKRQPHQIGDVVEELDESIRRLGSLACPLKRSAERLMTSSSHNSSSRMRAATTQDELLIAAELMSRYLVSSGALNFGGPIVQQSVRLTASLVEALEAGGEIAADGDSSHHGQSIRGQRREPKQQGSVGSSDSLSRREKELYTKLKATLCKDRRDERWLEASNSSCGEICCRLASETPLTTCIKIEVAPAPPPAPPPAPSSKIAAQPLTVARNFVGKVQEAPLALPLDVEVTEDIAPVCIGSGAFLNQSRREQPSMSVDRMGSKESEDDATLVVLKSNEELVFINGQLVKREKQVKAPAKPKSKQKSAKAAADESKGKRTLPATPTAAAGANISQRQTPLVSSRPQSRAPLPALRHDEAVALVERVRGSSGLYAALQIGLEGLQV